MTLVRRLLFVTKFVLSLHVENAPLDMQSKIIEFQKPKY